MKGMGNVGFCMSNPLLRARKDSCPIEVEADRVGAGLKPALIEVQQK
jgi:hypothetical protein